MRGSRLDTFITVEINILNPEKILNILSRENISVRNVKRMNVALFTLDIYEEDLDIIKKIIKKNKGKIKVTNERGKKVIIRKLKRRSSLIAGGFIFIGIIYLLSTHIWSIEIITQENVSPYEVRKILDMEGIHQGIKKTDLDVYGLEKKLEDSSTEIVWARSRIEGSTLKIDIEEKVNPPKLLQKDANEIVAKMDGEVKRVYAESGTTKVGVGDMVKEGDLLIAPYSGSEGMEFETIAEGTVIANTFYDKEVEIRVSGEEVKRTGESDKDIYISVFGKKIYLKKSANSFEEYDKIEDNDGFVKGVEYLEKKPKEVNVDKEVATREAVEKLEKLLLKDLTNEAKVVDKDVNVTDLGDGIVKVTVQFVVEQNIAL